MNPNRGEGQANFELTPQPPAPETGEQRQEQAVEAPLPAPERAGRQAPRPAPLPAVPDDIPAVDQPVIALPPDDTSAPPLAGTPAADADHIEREWVDKAKAVIAKTQDDPYTQKNEMSKVKAEYIQKRFNKTIKTDEAPA